MTKAFQYIFSGIIGAMLLSPLALFALVQYPPGALLQPNDVTSSHIRNGEIVNVDVSPTASIYARKIQVGGTQGSLLLSDGYTIATSSQVRVATSTGDLYVLGGRIHATTTNFGGVNYAWPSADGTNGQVLQTNGSGTLSFASVGGMVVHQSTTTAVQMAQATSTTFATSTVLSFDLYIPSATNAVVANFRFNGDTGLKYSYRQEFDGSQQGITTDANQMQMGQATTSARFIHVTIMNNPDGYKLVTWEGTHISPGSSGIGIFAFSGKGVYADSSQAITSLSWYSNNNGIYFAAGSRLVIYGTNI